jgi:hypothetical protein
MTNCPNCGYPTHTNVSGSCKSCRNPLVVKVEEKPEPKKAPALKKETKKTKVKKTRIKPIIIGMGDDATD